MTRTSATPEVPGVDLTFRPATYFWPLSLEPHLLARIKGAERNAALKQLFDGEDPDQIPGFLQRSALTDTERQMLGRIHPAFMGGEYLPNLTSDEVMIARITIASVTQDVTCVFARRGKNRIYYRVVDEYEGETLSEKRTRTSTRPLTLGELESFFNHAWSIFNVLAMNFGHDGYDLDRILGFVIGVDSEFYPQIWKLYRRRIETWAAAQQSEQVIERARNGHAQVASTKPGPRHE